LADIRAKDIGSGQNNGSVGLGFLCVNRDLYCCEKDISSLTISIHLSILSNKIIDRSSRGDKPQVTDWAGEGTEGETLTSSKIG
jgi:hypothetical protein